MLLSSVNKTDPKQHGENLNNSVSPQPSKLSTGAKIQIMQIIVCCLIAAMAVAAWSFGNQQSRAMQREVDVVKRLGRVAELTTEIKSIQIDVIQVQQFLTDISATRGLDGLADGTELAEEHAKSFSARATTITQIGNELELPAIVTAMQEAQTAFQPYYDQGKAMAKSYVAEGPAGGNKLMGSFDNSAQTMTSAIDSLITVGDQASASALTEAMGLSADTSTFEQLLALLSSFALAVGVGALFYTFRLQRHAESARVKAAQLQAEHDAALEEKAAHASVIISQLGEGLAGLAGGDLTREITLPFPGGMDELRNHFNSAAASLLSAITLVKESSLGIKSGTVDIAHASDDLSRRTENQAASLEETAAAVAQITATVKATASNAEEARLLASSAKGEAAASNEVVERAASAMRDIADSSKKINQIIGVMDEIALQTNLLALNAGVEAARAGDSGRGFSVVASEVRSLSHRSTEAAKEIKVILSQSNSRIDSGVQLVADTIISLRNILDRVDQIDKAIHAIAISADHQAAGLAEVNIAVDQMDQVTQQNAAMVEEANAATRSLTDRTVSLAEMVESFQTEKAA